MRDIGAGNGLLDSEDFGGSVGNSVGLVTWNRGLGRTGDVEFFRVRSWVLGPSPAAAGDNGKCGTSSRAAPCISEVTELRGVEFASIFFKLRLLRRTGVLEEEAEGVGGDWE